MLRFFRTLILLVSVIALPVPATETGYPTDDELRALPQYCHALLRGGAQSEEYKYWSGIVGAGFGHAHHFCQGMNLINRYYRARTAYDRKYYLGASLPEFGYMIKHADPASSLMPEVYLNRGFALWKLGKDGQAMIDFQKAQQLNPAFPRVYTALADFYVEKKLRDKALVSITEGIRHNPESKMLKRRYDELGGKKPYPEPYNPSSSVDEPPPENGKPLPPPQSSQATDEQVGKTTPATTAPETSSIATPQTIGTPGNPWCRFCPDTPPPKEQAPANVTPEGIQR